MNDVVTIERLLSIENDAAILDFRCPETELLLWPYVRTPILLMIITDLLYSSGMASEPKKAIARSVQIRTLARSICWNTFMLPWKADRCANVCIISSGIAGQWLDGKLFDRVSGHFSKDFPNTLTLEDHFEWRWPFPRSDERVLFLAPYRVHYAMRGYVQVRTRHLDLARGLIAHVRKKAMLHLGWTMSTERAQEVVAELARKIASLPQQYNAYERLLARIRPKLLMVGSGCFGGAYATMISVARSRNIPTAEFQHGAVSMGHNGYNLSPTLCASQDYRHILPDYFLSFGSWWNSQINVPLQTVVIGNPNRDAQISRLAMRNGEKTDVVILSDGMEFEVYLELAKSIESAVASRGWRLVIRPHPLERTWVEHTYGRQIGAIAIDQNPDILATLNDSEIVISEISTGLFEAIGLAENIYLWETPKSRFCYPAHPFTSFSSADELSKLIRSNHRAARVEPEGFWAPKWRENYLAFLAKLGIDGEAG